MHFGFVLGSSDIDWWNIDLLDTHLDLLDTDILSKNCLSPRHLEEVLSPKHLEEVLKIFLQDVFKQDMYLKHLQDMSSRRLEDVFNVTIPFLPRGLEDILKMSSWRLGRRNIVTLKTCWRRLQVILLGMLI